MAPGRSRPAPRARRRPPRDVVDARVDDVVPGGQARVEVGVEHRRGRGAARDGRSLAASTASGVAPDFGSELSCTVYPLVSAGHSLAISGADRARAGGGRRGAGPGSDLDGCRLVRVVGFRDRSERRSTASRPAARCRSRPPAARRRGAPALRRRRARAPGGRRRPRHARRAATGAAGEAVALVGRHRGAAIGAGRRPAARPGVPSADRRGPSRVFNNVRRSLFRAPVR